MHETNKEEQTVEQVLARLEAFEELLMSIVIQLSRMYDLSVANLRQSNQSEVIDILNDHEKGVLRGPIPTLTEFGKDFVDEEL
jgi:hypothetical protein